MSEKEIELSVIKKANDFVSFKFGDVQLLDIMKFLGGATTLYFFLKAYKASEMKNTFHISGLIPPISLMNSNFPRMMTSSAN